MPHGRQLARPVAVQRTRPPVELLHERAELQRHAQLPAEVDREPEVLGHEVEREALVVVAVEHAVDVALEETDRRRAGGKRPPEGPGLDAGFRPSTSTSAAAARG